MKKSARRFNTTATIVALLLVVIGSLNVMFNISPKIIKTFGNLFVISDNINFLNDQPVNNSITEEINFYNQERTKIYNSDDFVVSSFANLGTKEPFGNLLQLCLLILAFISYPAIIFMYIVFTLILIKKVRRSMIKIKRKQGKHPTARSSVQKSSSSSVRKINRNIN